MKALFYIPEESYDKDKLDQVAMYYGTDIKLDDDGISRFLIIKPKLLIKERVVDNKYVIKVWGATDVDIQYLSSNFGEPSLVEIQRLTPLEFAQELISIPNIMQKNKQEIITMLELDEKQYNQYLRLIRTIAKGTSADEVIKKAKEVLDSKEQL